MGDLGVRDPKLHLMRRLCRAADAICYYKTNNNLANLAHISRKGQCNVGVFIGYNYHRTYRRDMMRVDE